MNNRFAMKKSLEGHLLIAAPNHMDDARFNRTVVLLLHHDEQGAMGIILNRPLDRAVDEGPWQLLDLLGNQDNSRVQIGGPVNGPLIVLRSLPTEDANIRKGGVYVVEKRDQLEQLVSQGDTQLQFFVGHAGWTTGQLEAEIAQGSWLTTKALPDFVFGEHDDMWIDAIQEAGLAFYRDVLGVFDLPDEPSLN